MLSVTAVQFLGDETVAEAEGSRRESVGRHRIDTVVVSVVESAPEESQVEHFHHPLAQDQRQPLVVRDVLHLGADDLPGLVEQSLVVPVHVQRLQTRHDPVVFTQPSRVHGS